MKMNDESIFNEALEKNTPEERAAFWKQHVPAIPNCGRMSSRSWMRTMRASFSNPQPGAWRPQSRQFPIAEGPGQTIGPYKLLEEIGEGGMGVVYMAEQREPVRRRVALKIIKPGMDTREVIARFEAERQALALMDHPNIAKVLDAGATDSGRPYFVMELVNGVPITDYCDQNHLATRRAAGAVRRRSAAPSQHAHQKGIIHRDIKPSNVMVTLLRRRAGAQGHRLRRRQGDPCSS